MWKKTILFLLLLHSEEASVASPCWQGATFSEVVVSPAVESSGILRIPGVSTLPQCVAACCDLPGYDLAWLFEGHCYILSCQQRENCQPRQRPGADSFMAFLRRASPQKLLLQSLVRGEPYGGRWGALSPEAPGDLEDLKDLALFDGPQPGDFDPGILGYSDGSQEQQPHGGSAADATTDQPSVTDRNNQSEAVDGPDRGVAQIQASSEENRTSADDERTTAEKTNQTQSSSVSTSLTQSATDSAHHDHIRTVAPTLATPPQPSSSSLTPRSGPSVMMSLSTGQPTDNMEATVYPEATTDVTTTTLLSAATAPPTKPRPPAQTMTSDPAPVSSSSLSSDAAATAPPSVPAVSEGRALNHAPSAVVGPDRKLLLPLSSMLLDGRGSSDDHGVVSFLWDVVSGPPGLKMDGVDQAVATATGLQVGRYTFRLTVSDQEGASDSALLTVKVQEAVTRPPVAHASGSHTLTLPDSAIVLRGSVTDGDQTRVQYQWVRDSQSPAAGDVLYTSDTQSTLFLANLVEGTYLFQLRVTDAQGRSSIATATVEVQPEPGGGQEVELEMLVPVSQVSLSQRDTVVRQLAALLHVLNTDVHVRALQGHSHLSTVLRFSVHGSLAPPSGSTVVHRLRNQLLGEKSDFLLFRVLRVDTVCESNAEVKVCLLSCSGRGQCDPITKTCTCDPFWTENLVRRYLGDGESNCEWRMLYVILTSFLLMVFILTVSWTLICCCRKKQTKVRKKTKYTILDNMDEQERVELRPKFSIKHRSTEHNSSLMMSESELDSDQDAIFSRERPARSKSRLSAQASRNGNAFG